MDPLSDGWLAFFYGAAVIIFALATFGARVPRVNLVAAGLAVAFTPLAWNSLAAA